MQPIGGHVSKRKIHRVQFAEVLVEQSVARDPVTLFVCTTFM